MSKYPGIDVRGNYWNSAPLRSADPGAQGGPFGLTVPVPGETGTGKELIARAIHERSGRVARIYRRGVPRPRFSDRVRTVRT